jgi:molybdenum cofactor biosynthesis protein B
MGHHHRKPPRRPATLALLTVSDTRTVDDDRSGAVARKLVEEAGHRVLEYRILPDEPEQIEAAVAGWLVVEECDGVIVNGGTGLAPRDTTYEALAGLLDRRIDGFGELFRMLSFEQVGSAAMLSRAFGGVASARVLFALPGSPRAVELALEKLILPELRHTLQLLQRPGI